MLKLSVTWTNADDHRINACALRERGNFTLLAGERDRDDRAPGACTGRAARAVEVILGVTRCVNVNNKINAIDVNAASSNVCCNEHGGGAITEVIHRAGAGTLGLATMKAACTNAHSRELVSQTINRCLGANEEDGATLAGGDLFHNLLLVSRVNEQHVVIHRVDRRGCGCELVTRWISQVLANENVDVAVQRRREEETLPGVGGCIEQFLHRWQEPHVGHLIGFIKHRDRNARKICDTALDKIDEAAWCGDDDVHAALNCLNLLLVRHAAGDKANTHAQ